MMANIMRGRRPGPRCDLHHNHWNPTDLLLGVLLGLLFACIPGAFMSQEIEHLKHKLEIVQRIDTQEVDKE